MWLSIEKVAEGRKDDIGGNFEKLYNPESTKQAFSWHQGCLASYVSEEKIRHRKVESAST